VAVAVRGRSGGDSRSLGSMLHGSIDVDAGDVEVGLPCGANMLNERLILKFLFYEMRSNRSIYTKSDRNI